MTARERVALTIAALHIGQFTAGALFVVAIAAHLLALSDISVPVATAGVIAVIATPSLALVATIVEERAHDRATAITAALVLAVLAVAIGVAILVGR